MEVLLFATNINTAGDVAQISSALDTLAGIERWTVDTGDCDKVLRVVAVIDVSVQIEFILFRRGYTCQRIPYQL